VLFSVNGQDTTNLFLDDTIYYIMGDNQNFSLRFKDSLPDGNYKLFSHRPNLFYRNPRLLLYGSYCNGLKNGLFVTNYYAKHGLSWYLVNKNICFFIEGKKHGISEEMIFFPKNNLSKLLIHEEYEFGLKNGFFVYNNIDGSPRDYSYYYHDTLFYRCEYSPVQSAKKLFEYRRINPDEYRVIRYINGDSCYSVEFQVLKSILVCYKILDFKNGNIRSANCSVSIGSYNINQVLSKFNALRIYDFLFSTMNERISLLEHFLK